MTQIRGDYAFNLVQGDQIFILKDYLGKRSLFVGMNENHLMITSTPFDELISKEEGFNAENNEQENE